MSLGRNPKPTHLKAIDGGKAAGGIVGGALKAKIPNMPAPVKNNQSARGLWNRLAPELEKAGLLSVAYETTFGSLCVNYGRWVNAEKIIKEDGQIVKSPKGYPIQSPYLAIANRAMEQMRALSSELGLSPTSLSRASRLEQPDLFEDNPFHSVG